MTGPPPSAGPRGQRPGARRRVPAWAVAAVLVAVPLVEIWSIVQVGQVVGPWWTILLLLGTAVLGSWLVRREGARTWRALQVAVREGRMPHHEVADGVLVLLGGLLMLLPGFVSDVIGLLMVLPFTRPVGRRLLAGAVARRLDAAYDAAAYDPRVGFVPGRDPRSQPMRHTGPVVEGQVVEGQVVDEPGDGTTQPRA